MVTSRFAYKDFIILVLLTQHRSDLLMEDQLSVPIRWLHSAVRESSMSSFCSKKSKDVSWRHPINKNMQTKTEMLFFCKTLQKSFVLIVSEAALFHLAWALNQKKKQRRDLVFSLWLWKKWWKLMQKKQIFPVCWSLSQTPQTLDASVNRIQFVLVFLIHSSLAGKQPTSFKLCPHFVMRVFCLGNSLTSLENLFFFFAES